MHLSVPVHLCANEEEEDKEEKTIKFCVVFSILLVHFDSIRVRFETIQKRQLARYLLEFVLGAECARRFVFSIWTILDVIASGRRRRRNVWNVRGAQFTVEYVRTAIVMECTFYRHIEIRWNGKHCLWSYLCIRFHRSNRDRCHSRMWPLTFPMMSQHVRTPPKQLSKPKQTKLILDPIKNKEIAAFHTFTNSFAWHEWSHPFRSTFGLKNGAYKFMRTHRTFRFNQILKMFQILWCQRFRRGLCIRQIVR